MRLLTLCPRSGFGIQSAAMLLCFSLLFSCSKDEMTRGNAVIGSSQNRLILSVPDQGNGFVAITGSGSTKRLQRYDLGGRLVWELGLSLYDSIYPGLNVEVILPSSDLGCKILGHFTGDSAGVAMSIGLLGHVGSTGNLESVYLLDTIAQQAHRFVSADMLGQDIWVIEEKYSPEFNYVISTAIRKFGLNGVMMTKTGLPNGIFRDLVTTSDSSIYTLGRFMDPLSFKNTYFVSRYTSEGVFDSDFNIMADYDTVEMDFREMIELADGRLMLTGTMWKTQSFDAILGDVDMSVFVFDPITESVIAKAYDLPLNESPRSIHVDPDGVIWIAGITSSVSYDGEYVVDFYSLSSRTRSTLLKIRPDLSLIWAKYYGNSFGSDGWLIQPSQPGFYQLVGNQIGFGNKNLVGLFSITLPKTGGD